MPPAISPHHWRAMSLASCNRAKTLFPVSFKTQKKTLSSFTVGSCPCSSRPTDICGGIRSGYCNSCTTGSPNHADSSSEIEHAGCNMFLDIPSGSKSGFKACALYNNWWPMLTGKDPTKSNICFNRQACISSNIR
ncbi:hypothetical protein Taro_018107 [Colocasia esculenta]|uniref:Uncharacterized protein n=1 Tax=Colocasia esculenta TaxID=4460 RepID=A0A843V1F8_COLES|nr:hypothetical protein [Colocasia esculenta]